MKTTYVIADPNHLVPWVIFEKCEKNAHINNKFNNKLFISLLTEAFSKHIGSQVYISESRDSKYLNHLKDKNDKEVGVYYTSKYRHMVCVCEYTKQIERVLKYETGIRAIFTASGKLNVKFNKTLDWTQVKISDNRGNTWKTDSLIEHEIYVIKYMITNMIKKIKRALALNPYHNPMHWSCKVKAMIKKITK